jgi:hypothetical protein
LSPLPLASLTAPPSLGLAPRCRRGPAAVRSSSGVVGAVRSRRVRLRAPSLVPACPVPPRSPSVWCSPAPPAPPGWLAGFSCPLAALRGRPAARPCLGAPRLSAVSCPSRAAASLSPMMPGGSPPPMMRWTSSRAWAATSSSSPSPTDTSRRDPSVAGGLGSFEAVSTGGLGGFEAVRTGGHDRSRSERRAQAWGAGEATACRKGLGRSSARGRPSAWPC